MVGRVDEFIVESFKDLRGRFIFPDTLWAESL